MISLGALLVGAALGASPDTVIVFDPEPEYASHPVRTAMVATGWSLLGLNATFTPLAAAASGLGNIDCERRCHDTRPAWLTALPMVFTPSLPRWAVGDVKGALLFTGLRAASWTTAAVVIKNTGQREYEGTVLVSAFLLPLAIGIVDLATAPHREDLAPKKAVVLQGIGPAPVLDVRGGLQGMTLAASGVF